MRQFTVTQRYSAYGVVLTVLFMVFIWWFLLWSLTPNVTEIESVTIEKEPRIDYSSPAPRIDPYLEIRKAARDSGLEPRTVIAIVRAEGILTRHKDFEGACNIKKAECVVKLAEKKKHLFAALNRKPTPSDMLLAHTFGVPEAIKFSQYRGAKPTKEIDEEILKSNGSFLKYETVSGLRIWLGRTIYRLMPR